jgi:small GTP-binding protein
MKVQKRILFIGDEAIGKTAFCHVVQDKMFPLEYLATIEDTFQVQFQKEEITLVDTAGSIAFDRLRPFSYEGATHVVYCFALNDVSTLLSLEERWKPEIKYYTTTNSFSMLGLKADIMDSSSNNNEEIERIRNTIGCPSYYSCSALEPERCKLVLQEIIRSSDNGDDRRLDIVDEKPSVGIDDSELVSNVPTKLVHVGSQETLEGEDMSDDEGTDQRSTVVVDKIGTPLAEMHWKEETHEKASRRNTFTTPSSIPPSLNNQTKASAQTKQMNSFAQRSSTVSVSNVESKSDALLSFEALQKDLPTVRIQPIPLPKKEYGIKTTETPRQSEKLRKHASEMNLRMPIDSFTETRPSKKGGWSLFKRKQKPVGVPAGYQPPSNAYTNRFPMQFNTPNSSQRDQSFMDVSRPALNHSGATKIPKKKGFLSRLFK